LESRESRHEKRGEHAGEGIARGEGSKDFSDLGRMDILVI